MGTTPYPVGAAVPSKTGAAFEIRSNGTAVGPSSTATGVTGASQTITEGAKAANFDDGFKVFVDPADANAVKVSQAGIAQVCSGDGAITAKQGVVVITKAGIAVLTLAAPTAGAPSAGGDDGKRLTIVSATANAHTVTQASDGFNGGGGGSDLATAGGAAGNTLEVVAYAGIWYAVNVKGFTLA